MIASWSDFFFRLLTKVAWKVARRVCWSSERKSFRAQKLGGTKSGADVLLCIEAGEPGWESIEFQEILLSAVEFIGSERVARSIALKNRSYVKQFVLFVKSKRPTHFFYDPRTGSQNALIAIVQSFIVGFAMVFRDITPIVYLTDFSVRKHLVQAAIVTATRGVCVTFVDERVTRSVFPHTRLVGPSIMPFSSETAMALQVEVERSRPLSAPVVRFQGSLYEPRSRILEEIQELLCVDGIKFVIDGRRMGEPKGPIADYWRNLIRADICVTTTGQAVEPGRQRTGPNHLVYRVTEALVCGAALVAEDLPGLDRYFVSGRHFLTFQHSGEAALRVATLVKNPDKLEALRREGNKRIRVLIAENTFWNTINESLRREGMPLRPL